LLRSDDAYDEHTIFVIWIIPRVHCTRLDNEIALPKCSHRSTFQLQVDLAGHNLLEIQGFRLMHGRIRLRNMVFCFSNIQDASLQTGLQVWEVYTN
jgi:hypothetical protein